MYHILALITGIILAFMISINGSLSLQYGALISSVIIHIVGVLFAFTIYCFQKKTVLFNKSYPRWMYLGGVIGVITTVFSSLSYGHISVTSIVALGLLGQTITSLLIDGYGLLGMKKHRFSKMALSGLLFSILGIIIMVDGSVAAALAATAFAFASGVSIVLSRTVNANLSEKIGALQSSLVNHLTGLLVSVLVALAFHSFFKPATEVSAPPWSYMGGMLGVIVVMLCNITVPKVAAFRLTLITFSGQLFTGILLDCLMGVGYSSASFIGGLLIAFGVCLNLVLEKRLHS